MAKNDVSVQFKKFVFPSRRFMGKTSEQAVRRYLKWHDKNPDVQVLLHMFLSKESLPHKLKSIKHTNVHVLHVVFARVKNRTRITLEGTEAQVYTKIRGRLLPKISRNDILAEGVVYRPRDAQLPFVYDLFIRGGVDMTEVATI